MDFQDTRNAQTAARQMEGYVPSHPHGSMRQIDADLTSAPALAALFNALEHAYSGPQREITFPVLRRAPDMLSMDSVSETDNLFGVYRPSFPNRMGLFVPLSGSRDASEPPGFQNWQSYAITSHRIDREKGYDLLTLQIHGMDRTQDGRLFHMILSVSDELATNLTPSQIHFDLFDTRREDRLETLYYDYQPLYFFKAFARQHTDGTFTCMYPDTPASYLSHLQMR